MITGKSLISLPLSTTAAMSAGDCHPPTKPPTYGEVVVVSGLSFSTSVVSGSTTVRSSNSVIGCLTTGSDHTTFSRI